MKCRTMKLLDVVFFRYYSIYRKMPFEITPETSALTSMWVFMFIGVIGFLAGLLASLGKSLMMIAIFVFAIASYALLHAHFIKSGRWKEIVGNKPVIKSHKFSVLISIVFAMVGIMLAFLGPLLAVYIRTGSI